MAEPNLRREPSLNRDYRSYNQYRLDQWAMPSASLATKAAHALQIAFVALFMVAGIDKFTHQLTDWTQYLAAGIPRFFAISPQYFLYGVGGWEIFLAIGLVLRSRVFADLAAIWLSAIVINLLLQGQYFDIALRDFGLAAGACALARLSQARRRG